MRRLVIGSALLALAFALVWTLALADANVSHERIDVYPSSGTPSTVFVLAFHAPERTRDNGSGERHNIVIASAPKHAHDCIASLNVRAPDAPSGARVRVRLDPRKLGGDWCAGLYHGKIEELEGPACRRGAPCPAYLVTRGILGRFTLHVKRGAQPTNGGYSSKPSTGASLPPAGTSSPPQGAPPPSGSSQSSTTDTTPPTFAGLQSAEACTPGPVQPSEGAPYWLAWKAATDDLTPSFQIAYDIFVAHKPGSEDFSRPTWTTETGATTYKTPPLPIESEAPYFVVRARDQAGNKDQNNVERRGEQVCE
jgi:hypothetical protein